MGKMLKFFRFLPCCAALLCFVFPAAADPVEGHLFDVSELSPKAVPLLPYIPEESAVPDVDETAAVPDEIPPGDFTDREIMGEGETAAAVLTSFLLNFNGVVDPGFVGELAFYYVEEAGAEGVNHDVAFAQMCLETGFLNYGGLVTADMNNFCGLGSIGPGEPGESFSSPRLGVRAHIQHLKAYATDIPLKQELVDPRRRWVRIGSAPVIQNLAGTWAADRQYARKIGIILNRLYHFRDSGAFSGSVVDAAGDSGETSSGFASDGSEP